MSNFFLIKTIEKDLKIHFFLNGRKQPPKSKQKDLHDNFFPKEKQAAENFNQLWGKLETDMGYNWCC